MTTDVQGVLIDLDDTLYDYAPADAAARAGLFDLVASDIDATIDEVEVAYTRARKQVKARLGERASSHSRLLYLAELAHAFGRADRLSRVRTWEKTYWTEFLASARLRKGAREFLGSVRARGVRIAICTDLTLDVQLWKLEAFRLESLVDALAASEEVPFDKPEVALFELAAARIGVPLTSCVVIGDSPSKDGEGARRLGLRYVQAVSTCGISGGLEFPDVSEAIWAPT